MRSFALKLLVFLTSLAIAAAVSVDAASARKYKKVGRVHAEARVQDWHRGTNFFPAGPIYHGRDYLGDDPDPFIRSQIYRDLGAHYGGEN